MTIYQYHIGYINLESVLKYPDIAAWAAQWMRRAEQAQRYGNELVVFEVPRNELLYASMVVSGDLPGESPSLPTDPDFLNELLMPVGDME
jgi:hypothetical protein